MSAPNAEALHYRGPFLQRLMELRKTHDLFPFLERSSTTIASRAAVGAQGKLSVTPAYDLLFDQIPFIGWVVNYPWSRVDNDPLPPTITSSVPGAAYQLSTGACVCFPSVGASRGQVSESLGLITTDSTHGIPEDEWVKFLGGILLKETSPRQWQQWQEIVQLTSAAAIYDPSLAPITGKVDFTLNFLSANYFYAGLRGYRAYPKSHLRTPQKTRTELLDEGVTFEKFDYTFPVTVTIGPSGVATFGPTPALSTDPFIWSLENAPGALVQLPVVFNSAQSRNMDFLCHSLRVRPSAPLSSAARDMVDTIAVGLQPLQEGQVSLQNDLFPWRMALGMDLFQSGFFVGRPPQQKLLTQWDFPLPMTIPFNAQWNLLAQPLMSTNPAAVPNTITVNFDFIFGGELIHRG